MAGISGLSGSGPYGGMMFEEALAYYEAQNLTSQEYANLSQFYLQKKLDGVPILRDWEARYPNPDERALIPEYQDFYREYAEADARMNACIVLSNKTANASIIETALPVGQELLEQDPVPVTPEPVVEPEEIQVVVTPDPVAKLTESDVISWYNAQGAKNFTTIDVSKWIELSKNMSVTEVYQQFIHDITQSSIEPAPLVPAVTTKTSSMVTASSASVPDADEIAIVEDSPEQDDSIPELTVQATETGVPGTPPVDQLKIPPAIAVGIGALLLFS